MEKDLVCGTQIDEMKKIPLSYLHRGKIYYFCSDSCREKFGKSPGKFVK